MSRENEGLLNILAEIPEDLTLTISGDANMAPLLLGQPGYSGADEWENDPSLTNREIDRRVREELDIIDREASKIKAEDHSEFNLIRPKEKRDNTKRDFPKKV